MVADWWKLGGDNVCRRTGDSMGLSGSQGPSFSEVSNIFVIIVIVISKVTIVIWNPVMKT